ncbi:MAG: hypothetical protein K6F37_06625 [Lachnospiraceae bacterium]|nr:hypothetical protein [Lachnospiraceae bacterium]
MKRKVSNRVVICVDEKKDADIRGRLFNQYEEEPYVFQNSMQMLKNMDELYDKIKYPQASVRIREFKNTKNDEKQKKCEKEMLFTSVDILENKGKKATFAVDVVTRQNATWQGVIYWMEEDILKEFASFMDLLALIDNATE